MNALNMLHENINNDIYLKTITLSRLFKIADEMDLEFKTKQEIQKWLEMKDSVNLK